VLNGAERTAWETALYNLDQPVLLSGAQYPDWPDEAEYTAESRAYRAGLRRGAIEVIARLLGYPNNLNQLWGEAPLTIERGKYGRYGEES
jgi:hypothetical protein